MRHVQHPLPRAGPHPSSLPCAYIYTHDTQQPEGYYEADQEDSKQGKYRFTRFLRFLVLWPGLYKKEENHSLTFFELRVVWAVDQQNTE